MKNLEIDDELYQYIASNTEYIGESASAILRRLIKLPSNNNQETPTDTITVKQTKTAKPVKTATQSSASKKTKVSVASKANKKVTKKPRKVVNKTIKSEKLLSKHLDASPLGQCVNKDEFFSQRGVVGRFLIVLGALHHLHSDKFSAVCDIRGRDRLYFSTSEEELLAYGSSTNPRQIPNSPFWVISNSNTTRKKMMLTQVASAFGYSEQDIENIRELL